MCGVRVRARSCACVFVCVGVLFACAHACVAGGVWGAYRGWQQAALKTSELGDRSPSPAAHLARASLKRSRPVSSNFQATAAGTGGSAAASHATVRSWWALSTASRLACWNSPIRWTVGG
jgi:hypothetical protein